MVDLYQLLTLPILKNVEVVSGHKGLNRTVKKINSMEIPEIEKWLSENELLITTGYSIRHDLNKLTNLIYILSKKNCSGLMIKLKYIKEIPEQVLNLSNAFNLPIIVLPDQLPFSEIMMSAADMIMERNSIYLKKSEEIHRLFVENDLMNNSYQGISALLYLLTHAPNIIVEKKKSRNIFLVKGSQDLKFDSAMRNYLLQLEKAFFSEPVISDEKYVYLTFTKHTDWTLYVIIEKKGIETPYFDLIAKHLGTALFLEYNKEILINNQNSLLNTRLIIDLISGNSDNTEEISLKFKYLNWATFPYYILFFDIINFKKRIENKTEHEIMIMKDHVQVYIEELLNSIFSKFKVLVHSDNFLYIISTKEEDKILQIGRKIQEKVKNRLDLDLHVTCSEEIQKIEDFKTGYDRIQFTSYYTKFYSLSSFSRTSQYNYDYFIYQHRYNEDLISYYTSKLDPILTYEQENDINLIQTIDQYLLTNGNITKTAENLFLHRNTVKYRIEKVFDLLGMDKTNSDHKLLLELHQAIRIMKIIKLPDPDQ